MLKSGFSCSYNPIFSSYPTSFSMVIFNYF